MRRAHRAPAPRRGFTLIELLVVIAIISILVGLTAAAVIQYLNKIPVLQTTNDIRQLSVALENFKSKFGFYPPSRIKLGRNLNQYPNVATSGSLDQQSVAYLNQMFPRLDWLVAGGIDWSNGRERQFTSVILEGDECLVFFLGGIPTNPNLVPPPPNGCLGFSTDPKHPHLPPSAANQARVGPFYEFQTNRLVQIHTTDAANTNHFFSYLDAYSASPDGRNTVFAYFSSGKSANGYNAFFTDTTLPAALKQTSDCRHLFDGKNTQVAWPYAEFMAAANNDTRPPRYLNPNTYQILSAGRDRNYGRGTPVGAVTAAAIIGAAPVTTWTTSNPNTMYSPSLPAATVNNWQDDQSNFADGILRAGG